MILAGDGGAALLYLPGCQQSGQPLVQAPTAQSPGQYHLRYAQVFSAQAVVKLVKSVGRHPLRYACTNCLGGGVYRYLDSLKLAWKACCWSMVRHANGHLRIPAHAKGLTVCGEGHMALRTHDASDF
jgi:hypothetical protein